MIRLVFVGFSVICYFICYLLFVICYLLFVICYLLFVLSSLFFVICFFYSGGVGVCSETWGEEGN